MPKTTELFPIRTLKGSDDALLENEVLIVLRVMSGKDHYVAIGNTQAAQVLKYYAADEIFQTMWHYRVVLLLDRKVLGDSWRMNELTAKLEKAEHVIEILLKDPVPDTFSFGGQDNAFSATVAAIRRAAREAEIEEIAIAAHDQDED